MKYKLVLGDRTPKVSACQGCVFLWIPYKCRKPKNIPSCNSNVPDPTKPFSYIYKLVIDGINNNINIL
jgi:hypothetical protein